MKESRMKKIMAMKKIPLSLVLVPCLFGILTIAGVASQSVYPSRVTFHENGLPDGAIWSVGFGLSSTPSVTSSFTVGDPYAHLNSGGANCISFYTSELRGEFYFTVPAAIGDYQVATISPQPTAVYRDEVGPNTLSGYIMNVWGDTDIYITYSTTERYIVFVAWRYPYDYHGFADTMVIDDVPYPANTWEAFTWGVDTEHTFTFVSPMVDTGVRYEWEHTEGLSTIQSGSLTVHDSGIVRCLYDRYYEVTFAVDPIEGGTVSWNGASGPFEYGNAGTFWLKMSQFNDHRTFHISATASSGYTFSSWITSAISGLGTTGIVFDPSSPYLPQDSNLDYTYVDIGAPGTITAHFESTGPPTTDTTPPTTTKSLTGTEGNNGWFRSSVDVSLTSVDNVGGSGVKEIHYILDEVETVVSGNSVSFTVSAEGTYTLEHWAMDNAENEEVHSSQDIKIDLTPPTVSGAPTTLPNANGWYTSDVVVHFTATDSLSGIDTVTPDTTVSTEGAGQSVTGTATDKAGNSASTTVSGINIDWTPPVITIDIPHSGGTYTLNQMVKASWSATDDLSGIASASGTVPNRAYIDTSSEGTKTFEVTATDNAGNTATETVSYKVVSERKPPKPPHP